MAHSIDWQPAPDWHDAQVIEATTPEGERVALSPSGLPSRTDRSDGGPCWYSLRSNEWRSPEYFAEDTLADVRVIVDRDGRVVPTGYLRPASEHDPRCKAARNYEAPCSCPPGTFADDSEPRRVVPLPITDEMVERAARALAFNLDGPDRNWDLFTDDARAALTAALGGGQS